MVKEDRELVKVLAQAVAGLLLPAGAGPAAPIFGAAFERYLAGRNPPSEQLNRAIEEAAQSISKAMVGAEEAGLVNRGSGHAAVIDLTGILRRVLITPALLLQLELDANRLFSHLVEVAGPNLEEASPGRRGLLESALREITETVLTLAPDLPAVRLEFMRELLRRTRSASLEG